MLVRPSFVRSVLSVLLLVWAISLLVYFLSELRFGAKSSIKTEIELLESQNRRLLEAIARKHSKIHSVNRDKKKLRNGVEKNSRHIHYENVKSEDRPGELGKPVVIDKELLSPQDRKKYDDGWKNNGFNQYVSDMISLHRSLPDFRDEEYIVF
jgi:hypothetical protein